MKESMDNKIYNAINAQLDRKDISRMSLLQKVWTDNSLKLFVVPLWLPSLDTIYFRNFVRSV